VDAKWELADNRVMSVAGQARYPDSVLCQFLGDAPAYFDLLSFLPPAEYSGLLSAAGFSADESPVAATGTADPLLFDWHRVHQPVRCDDGQRAALAACLETAGMRNVQSAFSAITTRPGASLVPGAVGV